MTSVAVQATRCPSCAKAFFVSDAEDLGRYWLHNSSGRPSKTPLPESYKDAPIARDADLAALSELIHQTEDRDRLRYLRLQAWHNGNRANRYAGTTDTDPVQKPIGFDENLEGLIDLLEDDRGQSQLMKAEALRELGKYPDAISALNGIDTELTWAADQIRSLAQGKVCSVGVLLRPDEG